jgi:hypothetical protein
MNDERKANPFIAHRLPLAACFAILFRKHPHEEPSRMATTPETSPGAPGSTALDDRLFYGETIFVAGAALAFLSEVFVTFRTMMDGNGIGSVLGLAFIVGTVFFIARLYSGRKDVRTPAIGWMTVQAVIALIGTILILNHHQRGMLWAERVAVPNEWLGVFKIVSYAVFGSLICMKTPALFFIRHRGGEAVELPTALEDVGPSGVVLTVPAADKGQVSTLAKTLTTVGLVLLAAGFFEAVVGGLQLAHVQPHTEMPRWHHAVTSWLHLIEGGLVLLLGLTFLLPVRSLRNVDENGTDRNFLADSLDKLGVMTLAQVVLVLLILVITIANIIL